MKKTIIKVGLTEWKIDPKKHQWVITHNGNMGSSMEDIDFNLKSMGLLSIIELKETFPVVSEIGSPEYMYKLILDIQNI